MVRPKSASTSGSESGRVRTGNQDLPAQRDRAQLLIGRGGVGAPALGPTPRPRGTVLTQLIRRWRALRNIGGQATVATAKTDDQSADTGLCAASGHQPGLTWVFTLQNVLQRHRMWRVVEG